MGRRAVGHTRDCLERVVALSTTQPLWMSRVGGSPAVRKSRSSSAALVVPRKYPEYSPKSRSLVTCMSRIVSAAPTALASIALLSLGLRALVHSTSPLYRGSGTVAPWNPENAFGGSAWLMTCQEFHRPVIDATRMWNGVSFCLADQSPPLPRPSSHSNDGLYPTFESDPILIHNNQPPLFPHGHSTTPPLDEWVEWRTASLDVCLVMSSWQCLRLCPPPLD